jgi:acyl dehydratase
MKFYINQSASIEKVFTEQEVEDFSRVSMDTNPIHLDSAYASGTRFGQRIVQGPMVASLVGGVLGSKLPGPGTIYINQTTNFLKPVFINELLVATVVIIAIREDKPIIKLRTTVAKNSGEVVIEGEATVLFLEDM